jgi:hypothetical protein
MSMPTILPLFGWGDDDAVLDFAGIDDGARGQVEGKADPSLRSG